jgi:glycosyltransferase involved in cell wall biosynthesis
MALESEGHTVVPFTFTRQYVSWLFPGKTQYVTEKDKAMKVDSIPVLDPANPFTYRHAARAVLKEKPDMLFIRYWMSYFAPSLGRVARIVHRHGVKVVCLVDNAISHEPKPFERNFAGWLIKGCDEIMVMSDKEKKDVLSLVPKASVHLVRHPLYTNFGNIIRRDDAVRKLGLDSRKRILLFFGLIREYKGLDILIDAMNHLDMSYQLVIAGETYGSFDKYAEQIEQVNAAYSDRIKVFNRYIGDEEVALFFSSSDLCVLPYRSATQSGIVAVSEFFDVPVVTTPVGSLPDDINRSGIGLVADEISSEAVAAAIRRFFKLPREQFVNAIHNEKELLTWSHFCDVLLECGKMRNLKNKEI